MIEYFDVFKFISKKADLYNYINPFFNKEYLESHNFFYTIIALKKYKNYFDNLYLNIDSNINLDINQRLAIITNSRSELIIAGAGSGKTTTIAAKIKFMVEILNINPNEILLLSYTNEAVKEMQKIIVDNFKIKVKILTFHKFALLLLDNHEKIVENISYQNIVTYFNKMQRIGFNIYFYLFYDLKIKDIITKNLRYKEVFNRFQVDVNKYYFENLKMTKNLKSFCFKKISSIYNRYQLYFNTFDSIIYKASVLKNNKYHFKYILIDEYQDISNLRLNFIKNYVKSENSKLMCVGDDWQTIFSFASSNINNILNFDKSFEDAKILKITNTYRNSQELIDLAVDFIMKNKMQIKKKLRSKKQISNPIKIVYYANKEDLIIKLKTIIESIINTKIAFIGRYKIDVNKVVDNKIFKLKDGAIIFSDKKEIPFFTIHSSKGLGFDNVFLVNNDKGYYGFPPKRKEKSIFIKENLLFE